MPALTEKTSKALKQFLKPLEPDMLKMLIHLCEINSGSHHLQGLARMHDALTEVFEPIVDTIETHALPPVSTVNLKGEETHDTMGALLFMQKRPHLKRRILLSGHMDTVFGKTHPFQTVTQPQSEPNILRGPGVADMKGGIVAFLHALKAFETLGVASTIGWDVVINADEELGSPASRAFFESIRNNYQAAFVYEPAVTPKGVFARSRKGSGKFTFVAHGITAHAGRAFNKGKNAIAYLSEILVAINALNKNTRKITFNIGEIRGGEALNIVPDTAVAKLDIRTCHPEDEAWVLKSFKKIQKKSQKQGYNLEIHGSFGRPVKEINPASQKLFKLLKSVGTLSDQRFQWVDTGGCCDGNNLAEEGLAVIDTMGVVGGNIHSADEFIYIDSLLERAHLTSLILTSLAQGGLETLTTSH